MSDCLIAIDPSLAKTAVCALFNETPFQYDAQLFVSKACETRYRFGRYNDTIGRIVRFTEPFCEARPNTPVFIEGYSYGSKGQGVLDIAEFGGLLRMEIWWHHEHWYEVPPSTLKKFTCGKGNAKKAEMAVSAFRRWAVDFGGEDNLCDAYCLARFGACYLGWEKCRDKKQEEAVEAVKKMYQEG